MARIKDNDNKKNKNAIMLNEREAAYRSEDASSSFSFMIIMIIPYIFTMYLVRYHPSQFFFALR